MMSSRQPSAASATRGASRSSAEQIYLLEAEAFRRSGPALKAWSEAFRLERSEPLDFAIFPFQVELYEAFGDRSLPTVDVQKSGQCGVSAAGISLALYAADVWAADVLYVLPGFDDAYDFSDTRVKPSIEDSPYLALRVAGTDNKGLKQVGDANVYFRGSGSERKALSIPADVLILDEYDRLVQQQIPKFYKRLGAPTSLNLRRRFSNPSFPESGIHELYLASDQREWLVRCGCGHEAPIYYEQLDDSHRIDEERALRVCGRCSKPLGKDAIAGGRWVAQRPRPTRRGYHISKLIVPGQDMGELVEEHGKRDETSVQDHYNFDLGLPYSPKGGSVPREFVLACRRDWSCPAHYAGPDWVTAGVDVGAVLHVRISRWLPSGKAVPLYLGEIDTFEELAILWRRYGVNFGVIDERPEEKKAREFMNAHWGRVMLCRWSGEEQRDHIVRDEDAGILTARRTAACDRTVAAFEGQLRLLPRDLPKGYLKQVMAPHRVVETNKRGQKVSRYVSERADHFFFAEAYDLLAKEARGGPPAGASGAPPETIREQVRRRSRWH